MQWRYFWWESAEAGNIIQLETPKRKEMFILISRLYLKQIYINYKLKQASASVIVKLAFIGKYFGRK